MRLEQCIATAKQGERVGMRIVTAESCTSGKLAAAITALPDASYVFHGGVVAYSYALKQSLLGVDGALLETQGAVNAEVATQMALGALKMLGGTLAISTTGVAGPGKGENDPEVGTVFIGFAGEGVSAGATAHHFDGNRQAVVEQATAQALNILESLL